VHIVTELQRRKESTILVYFRSRWQWAKNRKNDRRVENTF